MTREVPTITTEQIQTRVQTALNAAKAFNKEGKIKEEEKIAGEERFYRERSQPLTALLMEYGSNLDQAIERAKRPKFEVEHAINEALQHSLTLGTRPPELTPYANLSVYDAPRVMRNLTYRPDVVFGFNLEEAAKIMDFPIKREVDPIVFVKHCEQTRRGLAYRKGYSPSFPLDNIYRFYTGKEGYEKKETELYFELEKISKRALDVMLNPFIRDSNVEAGQKVDSYYKQAKEFLIRNFHEAEISNSYLLATIAYFDFMSSWDIDVFSRSTRLKYVYEENAWRK